MKNIFYAFYIILFSNTLLAQTYEYRSAENPYYWKNRKPSESYWQQDVHYKIKASVDDKTDIVDGRIDLTYYNNSPDELTFVYFNLYNNAQTKGSYLTDLYENNDIHVKHGKYQQQGLGTNVSKITCDGNDLKMEQDNTILKVYLQKPLKSGESISFSIDFKTYFDSGTIRNRMKMFNAFGYKHYDLVHWYPRLAVYDKKFGWNTDQHMDHEFYGDFGTFDAEITFPNNYVLDATGILQNPDEVMPAELRQKLDIKIFATKPWNSKPSEIIKPDGTTKTWKFRAVNVHDFALTADPTYRIGETSWNGIKCIALVQEPHAAGWINAADYTAKIIKINSTEIGMYAYPKMIVADAQDGMEYPMLTLDGGFDPNYRDLFTHEISHNWFFGMLGSNETYRAAMDEGFTQFLSTYTYIKLDGDTPLGYQPESKYVKKFTKTDYVINSEVYAGYMNTAVRGELSPINTHSDGFNGGIRHGGGYSMVYYKTATMLYNLQYVLGDTLFIKAMQHYFDKWKICHPYWEDFKDAIAEYTHADLNWLFDEWFETTKTIDYGVTCVKKGKQENQYEITFARKGDMQMPIDFKVISKDGKQTDFHIPNTWFVKQTNATVLPRWIGWDKVKPEYTAVITMPSGIKNVIIDPSNRLADINMLNNSKKLPVEFGFDSKIYNTPDWKKYQVNIRPDIWYNGYDGFKAGVHLNGNYFNYSHFFDANIWGNTGLLQTYLDSGANKKAFDILSLRFNYRTPTEKFMKGSSFYFSAKMLDGLNGYLAGFDRKDRKGNNRVYMYFKSMYRADANDLNYLLLKDEWGINQLNNTINIGIEHNYRYKKGTGNINLSMRSTALMSDYDYANVNLTAINRNNLGKLKLNTRFVAQYGTGKNYASESQLYAAGANPEEMMDNKFVRSQGIFDPEWAKYQSTTNYLHTGGGLNLRGYSGYFMPEEDANKNLVSAYKGTTGAAFNAELEFDQYLPKIKALSNTFKLNTYLFGDAGVINTNSPLNDLSFSKLRADVGVGIALTIKKWAMLQTVDPLTIRFDMPLFLNAIPATDKDYVQFRWVIGISRAF